MSFMSVQQQCAGDEHQAREAAASSQKRENYWGGFELQEAALKSSKTQQPKKGI